MNLLSSLYGFAVCLEIFALAAMLRFLWNMINRFRRNPKTMERRRQQKLGRDGFLLIMTGVLFFAGMAFLNFALFIQSYRTFAVGEPIAKISVVGSPEDHSFIAKIEELGKPLRNQFSPMNHEYSIKGDRWMMEGHIIRFQPWLSFLGFSPVYQLTRIQGSYFSIDDELHGERSVFSLIDPTTEEWWRWMYSHAEKIPFMELMYGSAVSQDAKEGSRYVITVLPTGFSLQKAGDEFVETK